MSIRNEQCKKVCKILDDALANRPSERDTLIVAVQKAFEALADDGWISVEDKLPEFTDHFTDVDFDENGETYSFTAYESDRVLVCGIREDKKGIYTASYNKWFFSDGREEETEWRDCFGIDDLMVHDVTAWRPLPKPYEPKEDKC